MLINAVNIASVIYVHSLEYVRCADSRSNNKNVCLVREILCVHNTQILIQRMLCWVAMQKRQMFLIINNEVYLCTKCSLLQTIHVYWLLFKMIKRLNVNINTADIK